MSTCLTTITIVFSTVMILLIGTYTNKIHLRYEIKVWVLLNERDFLLFDKRRLRNERKLASEEDTFDFERQIHTVKEKRITTRSPPCVWSKTTLILGGAGADPVTSNMGTLFLMPLEVWIFYRTQDQECFELQDPLFCSINCPILSLGHFSACV